VNGNFRWQFSDSGTCGHRGRSFSMIIKNTDSLGSPGIGGFHASIIKDKFGLDLSSDYNRSIVCCGGFT
jgi:hypothetical protein